MRQRLIRLVGACVLLVLFTTAVRRAPTDSGDDLVLMRCETGQALDLAELEQCHALLPRDVEVMLDLGSLYEAAGQREPAEAIYRRALAVDPSDAEVRLRLGRMLLARGDVDGARREAGHALSIRPGSAAAAALASADGSSR